MVKQCLIHGRFEDTLSIDPAFSRHLEEVFPGRDIRAHGDVKLHNHGISWILYGRGAVLTIDLTNRCNMMCDPCFMDANQIGFVHELAWQDIVDLLNNAISIRPRRQMSVQFSGGEPTLSPYFVEAVRYARKVGYRIVQAATNVIEFANNPELAKTAAEAGLRYAYCNSTASGTPPTRIAVSAISSTPSSRPSKTFTTPASASFPLFTFRNSLLQLTPMKGTAGAR